MSGDFVVSCPRCGHGGRVPEQFAGHVIHCKHCDQHFTASPLRRASPVPTASAPPRANPSEDDDVGLAPLPDEEERHCRERYEARVLSKDRSQHYGRDGADDS